MRKKRILNICLTLLAAILLVGTSATSYALSTDRATEQIDPAHLCALSITCTDPSGAPAGQIEIKLYYIASVTPEYQFTVSDALSGCAIDINGIQSTEEWNSIMQTADAYITANAVEPMLTLHTNADGTAQAADLPQGIYYAVPSGSDPSYSIPPYMLSLPALADNGTWVYDVHSLPKTKTPEPPAGTELKIVKHWKDGGSAKRPASVTVDIYRDGALYETVTLNSACSWCYQWHSDTPHEWKAVEKNVPKDYTVRIEKDADTIVVTNILRGYTPQTGDDGIHPLLYIVSFASGVMIMILGIGLHKAAKHEKE